MKQDDAIVSVTARQVHSMRGHPGIETTVATANGAVGQAIVTAGTSVGTHEVAFAYDDGAGWMGKDWRGRGVGRAVAIVEQVIAPQIVGMDAARQREIDQRMIDLDGTPDKSRLGGNATASVSAAALKAGADALGISLYQHIGGANACTLPVPGVLLALGGRRYQSSTRSGTKPTYALMCYGFDTFADASYAAWCAYDTWRSMLVSRWGIESSSVPDQFPVIPPGVIQHDRELWDMMVELVAKEGLERRAGIQVDIAAATYYRREQDRFVGLFADDAKTRDELLRLYDEMVANYPFVIMEDPLDEDDFQGHAELARDLGIEIVGDDLFATNPDRVRRGVEVGACNTVLLKVNQIGTISEALDMVDLAYSSGYGVMPCDSRGEGVAIADYAVGLGTGHLREGALGAVGNRFLEIEAELGSRTRFAGRAGLKLSRDDR